MAATTYFREIAGSPEPFILFIDRQYQRTNKSSPNFHLSVTARVKPGTFWYYDGADQHTYYFAVGPYHDLAVRGKGNFYHDLPKEKAKAQAYLRNLVNQTRFELGLPLQ